MDPEKESLEYRIAKIQIKLILIKKQIDEVQHMRDELKRRIERWPEFKDFVSDALRNVDERLERLELVVLENQVLMEHYQTKL